MNVPSKEDQVVSFWFEEIPHQNFQRAESISWQSVLEEGIPWSKWEWYWQTSFFWIFSFLLGQFSYLFRPFCCLVLLLRPSCMRCGNSAFFLGLKIVLSSLILWISQTGYPFFSCIFRLSQNTWDISLLISNFGSLLNIVIVIWSLSTAPKFDKYFLTFPCKIN